MLFHIIFPIMTLIGLSMGNIFTRGNILNNIIVSNIIVAVSIMMQYIKVAERCHYQTEFDKHSDMNTNVANDK